MPISEETRAMIRALPKEAPWPKWKKELHVRRLMAGFGGGPSISTLNHLKEHPGASATIRTEAEAKPQDQPPPEDPSSRKA